MREPQPAEPARHIAPPASSTRLLLIEDNPLDARLIHIMVGEAGAGGFHIERVDRLSQGFERLAENRIDLVLLDLSLPDSHGLATFEKVHAAYPKVPVIVMSGLDDQGIAVQAVHEGAQDFLVKGQVNGPLLIRAMRYALERTHTAEQLERYSAELRRRNNEMEADLAMAREIQQVFLPATYPSFPASAGADRSALRFVHRYLPAAAVSGDFFNIFALGDTKAGILICDVMGHGMRAALVTAIMRGLVEELLPVAHDAGKFLCEINHSLHAILRRTDVPMLCTSLYMVLDVAEGIGHFASAGHPSPFLVRRQTGVAEPLKVYDPKHGPALGLFEDVDYPIGHFPLAANDLIVLYTDGIYEVNGRDDDEYGQDRLLGRVRAHAQQPAERLFDEILQDVRHFAAGTEFEDDVCLVGVEVQWFGQQPSSSAPP